MTRVTLGKSRVRESRLPGSVRAKAKWLSYLTTILSHSRYALAVSNHAPSNCSVRMLAALRFTLIYEHQRHPKLHEKRVKADLNSDSPY
ncbi:hypothetical protein ABIC08_008793 [Bradyrhizobium sp. RT9b]